MFKKFILENNMGAKVSFETDYCRGYGTIVILGDGKSGISTDNYLFPCNEIKKLKVLK